MKGLFGGILMAVGILIAGASGLCSLVVLFGGTGTGGNIIDGISVVLMFGGLPFAIGLAMFFGGDRRIGIARRERAGVGRILTSRAPRATGLGRTDVPTRSGPIPRSPRTCAREVDGFPGRPPASDRIGNGAGRQERRYPGLRHESLETDAGGHPFRCGAIGRALPVPVNSMDRRASVLVPLLCVGLRRLGTAPRLARSL